ncbi:M1 family peptidase, partial [Candidatus Woesearchaeota archaeon]|nr:M1 family peptidase [Candidatus Woesearchaeota archaeon]
MPPYLDSSITPTNYKLHVEPDLAMGSENWFRGSETITLQALEPISRIVLNGKGLEIRNAQLGYDGKTTPIPASAIRYDPSPDNETITLELGQLVKKGLTVKLSFDFSGKLGSGKGLYKSMYTGRDGKPAIMASTQFEPADAREAFPCLDHPSAKATFDVSVTLDDRHEALSNTEPVHETRHGDGRKTVTFATTLKMSTYLLYIGVGEFEYLEDKAGNTAVRIVTMPGKKQQGRFAMSAAKKFLSYYETYFGIPYPLKKLDFIAVPDFTSGAMENWGAITFREDALLCDEKTASLREKQRIAITLSHELVHQWFGNLVTMEWWNGLWLNESFADMMAYKAVEEHYPELDPWAAFLARAAGGAFQLDDMSTTHPIDVDVRAPYEVDEVFDAISYTKGGMVLRMIERFIGSDAFRNGLHAYLTRHQYGNTTGDDLWAALSEASGKNVTEIARSWTGQPGFPLLTIHQDGQ